MEYTLETTAAGFDTDVAAQGWPADVAAAVAAAKPLTDLTVAPHVQVDVAVGELGGWAVVRIAPFHLDV